MSEAIEFSIGGDNKAFTVVLKDTEQKAKDSAGRVAKELDKHGKSSEGFAKTAKASINDLAGEFAKVTSAAGAFDVLLSRVGTGLKAGGAIAAVAATTKGIYDATQELIEFERTLARIDRMNAGGVANYSDQRLEQNWGSIREILDRTQKEADLASTSWAGGLASAMKGAFENLGTFILTGESGTWEQVFDERVPNKISELEKRDSVAMDRIAEKRKQIFAIETERIRGNREQADLMQLEAEYAEKIQMARDSQQAGGAHTTSSLPDQLQRELETKKEALRLRNLAALAARTTAEAGAAMGAGDAQRAVGMSAQEEQRQANQSRLAMAQFQVGDIQKALEAKPGDLDLQAKLKMAVRDVERIQAENAKWERDIARSKKDQLDLMDAQERATGLRMRGLEAEAAIVEKKARAEDASRKAIYEGNALIAERIRKQDELERKAERFARALDPETGRLRPAGERISDARRSRVIGRQREKSLARFEGQQGGGLLRVERNSRGDIISGIDPETGRRVNAAGDEIKRKVYGGAINTPVSLRPGGGSAADEMDGRQGMAASSAAAASAVARAAEKQVNGDGGMRELSRSIGQIERVLDSWDKGQ